MANQDEKWIRGANIISPIASAMSLLNPLFLAIPIMSSVANELFSFFDSKSTEKRLLGLENEIKKEKIRLEDFAERISELEEHSQYVLRNNIKHLCLTAQPEITDALNKAIIECVMGESYGLAEHSCEILQQCNSDDILLLEIIKNFLRIGDKHEYQKRLEATEKEKAFRGFRNRSYSYGPNRTIFWKDLVEFLPVGVPIEDLSVFLSVTFQTKNEEGNLIGEEYLDLAYLARSLIKLQSLGVLVCDFVTTVGTSSTSHIDRIHITLFGEKLLTYIELDETKDIDEGDHP